uniref:Uncharacterized protein n=1 Tax=Oryza glumipatula TaxID=40148 RepID=A0A0D9ZTK0_9ORYZ
MASASTAVASATAGTTRSFEKLSAPWMIGRGHVALPPSPGRYPAVTVAAASRRTGEGGRRRRRARGADQEDGLSLSSEIEAPSSTPPARTTDKESTKPASETGITKKGSAIRRVTLVVLAAVFFGVSIALRDGVGKASEYFAGYLLEQSLSVDNLFVFVLVFKYFKVPQEYQRFEAVNLLLALILLFTSYKLFAEEDEESDLSDNFIVKTCQRFIPVTDYYDGDRFFTTQEGLWKATPLLLTVAVIELSDIAFAIDSIPAVFGVTRDPLIVLSSNIFAISGLRSLYVLISESMSELDYLQPAIGIVLGFIGTKMVFDFFGYHIPTEASLAIVTTCLSGGVILSLRKASTEEKDK